MDGCDMSESSRESPNCRPRVGITMEVAVDEPGHGARKVLELPADYAESVFRAGGIAVPLACTRDAALREEMIGGIDGLLLSGGNDLDPRLYGQEKHRKTRVLDSERQDFDLALLALAEARGMPTLGICLGCQVMNVQRRGTLHQHLPEVLRGEIAHSKPGDRVNAHEVQIRPGTRLGAVMGLQTLVANSRHHQGLDRVGHGLVSCALAPDGLVEAVEDPSLPFWLGVQWHPENLAGTVHERLFAALVEAARAFRGANAGIVR
jgi:putative glutamine amidotransferase